MASKDLLRRLSVLEGALGIDPISKCSGDPTHCQADPCTRETCPMSQNRLQELAREVGTVKSEMRLLVHLFREMVSRKQIPEQVYQIAALTIQREDLGERVAGLQEALAQVGESPNSPLRASLLEGLRRAQEEGKVIEAAVQKLREEPCSPS